MALLELDRVCAGYGGAPVLREVSLTVDAGEVVALLGANGAGKSTTMLTVAGELPLQGGSLRFDGVPLRGSLTARARRGLSLITEDRSLFTGLSVRDNLRLGRGGIAPALELFPELAPLLGRRAGLLSGGEQQMLTLGRALAARPRLLLVDELSLGLAPRVVDRLLDAVAAMARAGTAVLVVEQHARKALAIADRGYVLCRGAIDLEGSGAELLRRSEDVRRSYLG